MTVIIAEGASLPARRILSGLRVCSTPLKHFSEDESCAKVRGGDWGSNVGFWSMALD
jgi:hypothetical protein